MDDEPQASPPNSGTPFKSSDPGWFPKLSLLNGPQKALALVSVVMLASVVTLSVYQVFIKEQTPATSVTAPATASVSITSSGPSPATITVSAGTVLTWTNDDTKPHQIAADPHPSNDSIPGFESDTSLLPGDSLSFAFEDQGLYTYHDHLNPLDRIWQGRVVVE